MDWVLVTGVASGMGRKCASFLAKNGFFVLGLDINPFEGEENLFPVIADITAPESLAKALDEVKKHTKSLYAVIHFAGVYMLDSLVEMPYEKIKRAVEINFLGAVNVNKTFLPLLKEGSRILITTSELAPLYPLPFTGLYAVTKSALDKYAYSLRMELQLLNIKVSVLRAGAVNTPMLGVSTGALDSFCQNTKLYSCNAARFKRIVDSVEAKNIPPEKVAKKVSGILLKKRPRFAYSINRNPLLLLLNALPKGLQLFIIKLILKEPKK